MCFGNNVVVKDDHLRDGITSKLHPIVLHVFNSSEPAQNGRHFADDIFRCIVVYEKFCR